RSHAGRRGCRACPRWPEHPPEQFRSAGSMQVQAKLQAGTGVMIRSGRARSLVLLQKKGTETSSLNDTVSWVEDRRAWVSITPARGREIFKGDELASVVTHTVRGDFLELEGIDETMRMIFNDTHDFSA